MIAPARRAAYEVLRAVSAGRTTLPDALERARPHLPDARDRALAAEIVTGTLRWRGRLDWILERIASRDPARLDPEVLDILRLGLYQILFLDRVPAAAAVDDAVSLTKRAGKRSAAGFVNAVLRRVARDGAPPLPSRPGAVATSADREAALDFLSITQSHPRWLSARWLDRLGFEAAAAWVAFDNEEAPVTLRANRLATTRDELAAHLAKAGVETTPTRYAPDGLVVTGGRLIGHPDVDPSLFVIQDEASQLVIEMTGAAPGQRVLDACAAPGGKTIGLAGRMRGRGLLVAADVRARRVALLRRTLAAAGAKDVKVLIADAAAPLPFAPIFDLVLLDAPCTGLGTLRRDPEIRWRRTERDIEASAARQRRMIAEAARVVAEGGRLVYSTCSSEPEENQQVVEAFLASHGGFAPIPRSRLVAEGAPEAVLDASGFLETRPDRHGLEAFFAAALQRTGGRAV